MQNISKQQSSIKIIGAGAIGHLLAAFFHKAKIPCQLYSQQTLKPTRFQLISGDDCYCYQQDYHGVSNDLSHWRGSNAIIISVKAPDLEPLCQQLAELGQNYAVILLLMNGMGLVEITKKWLSSSTIVQGTTTHGAYLSETLQSTERVKQLHHTGQGITLVGNPLEPQQSLCALPQYEILKDVIDSLNKALPETRWQTEYQPILWHKLIINSVINPLTGLYDVNNGAIVSDNAISQMAYQLTEELAPLITIHLPQSSWQQEYKSLQEVALATRNNISSMRQDIKRGRITEIDYISGYLLKSAQQHGIKLPLHQKLYQQLIKRQAKH